MKKFISVLAAAALEMCAVPMAVSATEGEVITYVYYGREYSIKGGDVNEDGYTDARDATIILDYYADISCDLDVSTNKYLESIKKYGDVDEDGKISGIDATEILCYYTYVAGLEA